VIEAEYEWPFQSHASMGPACALVEIKDGKVTCWSGTQKSHFVQQGLAATLGVPVDNRARGPQGRPRLLWPQRRRRCRHDAAVLAKAVGKPVRLQYMRGEGTAGTRRTGLDPQGARGARCFRQGDAYEFVSKGFSRVDVEPNGSKPFDTLAGQAQGVTLKSGDGFGIPAGILRLRQQRAGWETIPPLLDRSSPLRSSHLRDPVGPQIHFASESFMTKWRRR